jgi:CBS domain containing-hemolysin-like protein
MTLQFIGLILLLLLSGFFSSSELAFVVSNKMKIELRARKNNLAAKNALYFVNDPPIFFSTILIANNIINITFASIITVFLLTYFQLSDFLILLITSSLLLLFGELIPKYIAREFADRVLIISVLPIRIITFILYPFVKLTSSISSLIIKDRDISDEEMGSPYDKEDIQDLIEESSEAGYVAEVESDIINKIFDLGEQKIYEAMTPRTDIIGVEINSSIEEVINTFTESGYSKLPVYDDNLDKIKGVVYAYDMFKYPKKLNDVIRDIIFVPETKKSLEMLNEFLDKQVSVAIVVDEFGGTEGILTVEDIIEEMLGEIRDEYDVEEEACKKIDEVTYVISGKVEIDHLNEEFELNIREGDYETLGGYITTELGRIPERNEAFEIDNFKFQVLHSDKTKVNLVKLFVDLDKLESLD